MKQKHLNMILPFNLTHVLKSVCLSRSSLLLSISPLVDQLLGPFCPSVCVLLCKEGACIIRLERGSHWGGDNAPASHDCCRAASRDASVLHKPVWMNNEECLSLQNIPASLLLRFSADRPKLGHAGAPELGQRVRGRRFKENTEEIEDGGDAGASLHFAFLCLFWNFFFLNSAEKLSCRARNVLCHLSSSSCCILNIISLSDHESCCKCQSLAQRLVFFLLHYLCLTQQTKHLWGVWYLSLL